MPVNLEALRGISAELNRFSLFDKERIVSDAILEIQRHRAQNVGANEGQWQPIETAPKDGRWFLGHIQGRSREATIPFRWSQRQFEKFGNGWDFRDNGMLQPTHWRPLPDAPDCGAECGVNPTPADNLEVHQ